MIAKRPRLVTSRPHIASACIFHFCNQVSLGGDLKMEEKKTLRILPLGEGVLPVIKLSSIFSFLYKKNYFESLEG